MRILAWPARRNADRNPFQKLLYDEIESAGDCEVMEFSRASLLTWRAPEILHLHWPDVFLASGRGWRFWPRYIFLRLLFLLAALRGTRVVWTAHNLQRHGQKNEARLARYFWPWFLSRVDGVIFMTRASAQQALKQWPALRDTPHAIIPHGHYLPLIGAAPAGTPAPPADRPPLLLFFGAITPYKNAWKVLESFLQLPAGQARLRICGEMSRSKPDLRLQELLEQLPDSHRDSVSYEDRFLSEEELLAALREADLVVFPYVDVLNSGAAIFALSCHRPILASDNALFRELQEAVGQDWVRLIDGGALSGGQLQAALNEARALRGSGAQPDLAAFDWSRIGAGTLAFYHRLAR
ncbi:glycosyltransferase [Pseudooceanicola marinus]|uniref:glycosyltransferase n=1 Tax=Pseudooceanicola marinus TaxID=396013 RepID=UPI001CD2F5A1|nr:glycosyltransferase [Pseudooceanicola marinus]MCA1338157.1 glycosyltransferase [Pseudooceanicola marinus]